MVAWVGGARRFRKPPFKERIRLTDLLTRPCGTGETTRDTGDAMQDLRLVSETPRNAGDGGDVRRMAHNPATQGTRRSVTLSRVPSSLANASCGPEVASISRFVWEPGPLRASRRAACAHDF